MIFFVNFFVLGYVGMKPAEGIYLLIARIGLVYYFGFLLILTPLIGKIEKSTSLPASISDVFINDRENNISSMFKKEMH